MRSGVILVISGVFVLSGCSPTLARRPTTPELAEQLLFEETARFYCDRKRWPLNFDELTGYVAGRTSNLNLAMWFPAAELTSTRAIVASVQYDNRPEGVSARNAAADAAPELRRISLLAPPACEAESAGLAIITMAGGRVSFHLPEGFEPLPRAGIAERWKDGPQPDVAWEHSESKVLLALRFGETPVSVDTLAGLKEALETAYSESVLSLKWISRKLDKKNPVPYLAHEFESDSSRGRLVTVSLSFPFDEKLLTVHVIGAVDKRAEVEKVASEVREGLLAKLS